MAYKIGIKINKIRKQHGLTQYQLADMVRADVSTINKIERNKANPSLDMLSRIAAALNVTISELLKEKNQEEDQNDTHRAG